MTNPPDPTNPTKQCKQCHNVKLLTDFSLARSKAVSWMRKSYCKDCERANSKKRYGKQPTQPEQPETPTNTHYQHSTTAPLIYPPTDPTDPTFDHQENLQMTIDNFKTMQYHFPFINQPNP